MISGCRQSTGRRGGERVRLYFAGSHGDRRAGGEDEGAPNMPVSPPMAVIVPKSPLCAVLRWRREGGTGRAGR